MKKHLVVLSGAGISAESGVPTFRDADGLWMGYDIQEVASIEGWRKDPQKVLDFYNMRRKEASKVAPNRAHQIIAELESKFRVTVITQNVDNLHEKAGSSNVVHLHGELFKMHSELCTDTSAPGALQEIYTDIHLGDLAADGGQLRPFIVWFGEMVPLLPHAMEVVSTADLFIVVGTSLQVYPAAGLIHYAPVEARKFIVDIHPPAVPAHQNYRVIAGEATAGMEEVARLLLN